MMIVSSSTLPRLSKASIVRFFWLLLAAVVLCVFATNPVSHAMSQAQQDVLNKQIYGFDADVGCETSMTESSLPSSASASERLRYIYTWLRGKSLTPIQAAAVVGNIAVESGGNPLASQNPKRDVSDPMTIPTAEQAKAAAENNGAVGVGHAWGIIQWDHGARAIYYQKKANISGSISDMNTQLLLVLWHMKNESPTSKNNMFESFTQTTVEEAVAYFEHTMEGAGRPALGARENAAKIALQEYEGASSSSFQNANNTDGAVSSLSAVKDLASSGCLPTGTGAGGGLGSTTAAYVWPYEWRNGGSPNSVVDGTKSPQDLTPAYKAAIAKANSTYFNKQGQTSTTKSSSYPYKLYTGYNDGGVDCGGFVTRLVQDSGLDPYYNMVDGKGVVYNQFTGVQKDYLEKSGRWSMIKSGQPSSYYKPGDVAMQDGHTLIFVGDIPSFWPVKGSSGGSVVDPSKTTDTSGLRRVLLASASLNKRAPMADKDERVGSTAYDWYRYTGGTSL